MVAWLYWSGYISPLLTKMSREKPKETSGASLKRLMGYMLPYTSRFVVVLILVALSSWGMWAFTLAYSKKLIMNYCCVTGNA